MADEASEDVRGRGPVDDSTSGPGAALPGTTPEIGQWLPRSPAGRGGRIDFDGAEDEVEQASQESFPASDPPAYTSTTSLGRHGHIAPGP